MPDSEQCPCRYPAHPHFDSTQSSLVFVNTCFAIAFGSVFILLTEVFSDHSAAERVSYVAWSLLATYLVFVVWRQYSSYYIPLQFHSRRAESFGAELVTFAITVALGLIALSAAKTPEYTPLLLVVLILLNVLKLRQMRTTLEERSSRTAVALKEIGHLARRLRLHLFFLLCVLFILYSYHDRITQTRFAITVVTASLVLHALIQHVYQFLYQDPRPGPDQYTECISKAWLDNS